MINFVKGKLENVGLNSCLVEFGGLGIELFCANRVLNKLRKKTGKEIKIWTVLKIKEEEMLLYGFLEKEEIDFFRKLVSVSGIGPKSAMSIMDLGDSTELIAAIDRADTVFISKAQGVGKKTAQRLIVELKGKLVFEEDEIFDVDVVDAMKALGYSRVEYTDLVKLLPEDLEGPEKKIAWLLKRLGK